MAFQPERHVFVVEFHADTFVFFTQHTAQQVGRFFRQDERGGDFGFDRRYVFDELVRVGRHERNALRFDVDVDAVHHRTQFVVGRREDRFVDARKQHVRVGVEFPAGFRIQFRQVRIAQPRSAGNGQLTGFPAYLDLPGRFVGFDRQRLFRELFQRVEHQFYRDGDQSFFFHIVHFQRSDQRGFQIRSGDFEDAFLQVEQEVVQNGQRVFVADDFTRGLQHVQQRGRRYDEFHMLYILVFYMHLNQIPTSKIIQKITIRPAFRGTF